MNEPTQQPEPEGDSLDRLVRMVSLDNKQSVVDLLFAVQTGNVSCRKAASVLCAVHEGIPLCEGCTNPATTSDSEGVDLCDECAKALNEEDPPNSQINKPSSD